EEVAVLCELFDRVAAIEEDALVAVDVGDGAPAVSGVHERRVVRHQTEVFRVLFDLAQIHGPDRAILNRQGGLLARAGVDYRQPCSHRLHFRFPQGPCAVLPRSDSRRQPTSRGPEAYSVRCRRGAMRDPPDVSGRTRRAAAACAYFMGSGRCRTSELSGIHRRRDYRAALTLPFGKFILTVSEYLPTCADGRSADSARRRH